MTEGLWMKHSTNHSLILFWSASTASEKKRPFNSLCFSLFFSEKPPIKSKTHRESKTFSSERLWGAGFSEGHKLLGWHRCVLRRSWAALLGCRAWCDQEGTTCFSPCLDSINRLLKQQFSTSGPPSDVWNPWGSLSSFGTGLPKHPYPSFDQTLSISTLWLPAHILVTEQ